MSNNVDLYIQELETTKVEIKNAIIAKGVTPEGGLSSYADAISSIESSTFETETLSVELSENGTYNYTPTVDGYSSVEVMVDVPEPDLRQLNLSVTENGSYEYDTPDNIDGYNKVNLTVEVAGSGGDTGKPKIYNGFRFTGGDIATVDFSQYDWSDVYDGNYFFESCKYTSDNWNNFNTHFNGKFKSAKSMFNAGYAYDFKSFPDLSGPAFGNICNAEEMFDNNANLKSVSYFDTSNCVSMEKMFNMCIKLTSIPQLDTSNCRNMTQMFYYCSALTSIPQLDTSKCETFDNMFRNCSLLTGPLILDTRNATTLAQAFQGCKNLNELTITDLGNLTTTTGAFNYENTALTTLYGCVNLGKSTTSSSVHLFDYLTNLTRESALNILNGLYDRKTAGLSLITLYLPSNVMSKLTAEDKLIATNKGWNLASS